MISYKMLDGRIMKINATEDDVIYKIENEADEEVTYCYPGVPVFTTKLAELSGSRNKKPEHGQKWILMQDRDGVIRGTLLTVNTVITLRAHAPTSCSYIVIFDYGRDKKMELYARDVESGVAISLNNGND